MCLVKQRLNGGLPLSAEELENVFDTLDSDGNGYLTLEEFSSGFSMFAACLCLKQYPYVYANVLNVHLSSLFFQVSFCLARGFL